MTLDGWITVVVIATMVVVMGFNLAGPDLVLVGGLTVLLSMGVIEPSEAFVGLSNPAIVTIGALYIVAAGIKETGGLDWIARSILGRPRFIPWGAQMRMMWPVAALSAFLNNTPVVAMFIPLVQDWARRIPNLRASMLLMPLSYAAILGGTCTIIGTSTNLVVAGMAEARDPNLTFPIFEIGMLGAPALLVGVLYVIVVSSRLLKDRKGVTEGMSAREYTITMRVEPNSPVIGQKVATLRALEGLFLVELSRSNQVYRAVSPNVLLEANDILRFTGKLDSIGELRKMRLEPMVDVDPEEEVPIARGSRPPNPDELTISEDGTHSMPAHAAIETHPERNWIEAVLAPHSELVGMTVRDTRFRTKFKAAILSVHRQGERIKGMKVGDIVLEPADVLLIEAQPGFVESHQKNPAFALLAPVENSTPLRHDRAGLASAIMIGMVLVNVLGVMHLMTAALLAGSLMMLTGCLSGTKARRALEWKVLVAVASAFGIATGLERSGAAEVFAELFLGVGAPFGPVGILASLYFVTAALAGVVSTTAAAALMFPIAAHAAEAQGLDLVPTAYIVMLAASTAFSTPIGYQTNLMVAGPGGYKTSDFVKLGLPLQVIIGVLTVALAWCYWL